MTIIQRTYEPNSASTWSKLPRTVIRLIPITTSSASRSPSLYCRRPSARRMALELGDVFGNVDLAIGTYRHTVSTIIPEMTRVALLTKRADLVRENPDFSEQRFLYRLSRSEYEKEWGQRYQRPGLGARILAVIVRLLPRIGPLKAVDYTLPSSTTEDLYVKSVNRTVDSYDVQLASLQHRRLPLLPNLDFDTGEPTQPGEYGLADETYAKLVDRLAARHFDLVTAELRTNILAFYSSPSFTQVDSTLPDQRRKIVSQVNGLRGCRGCGQ